MEFPSSEIGWLERINNMGIPQITQRKKKNLFHKISWKRIKKSIFNPKKVNFYRLFSLLLSKKEGEFSVFFTIEKEF